MFKDRRDAGVQLTVALKAYQDKDPLIFALPRGGVPVAYPIAKAFHVPLYVWVARKIGAPFNPEYGVGAISHGVEIFDERVLLQLHLSHDDLQETIVQETIEMNRRSALYGMSISPDKIQGKIVIVIDDGIATGITAEAALKSIKRFKPGKLILAVPVGARSTMNHLKAKVDELICLETHQNFKAVGEFYQNFSQTTDAEVLRLLSELA